MDECDWIDFWVIIYCWKPTLKPLFIDLCIELVELLNGWKSLRVVKLHISLFGLLWNVKITSRHDHLISLPVYPLTSPQKNVWSYFMYRLWIWSLLLEIGEILSWFRRFEVCWKARVGFEPCMYWVDSISCHEQVLVASEVINYTYKM